VNTDIKHRPFLGNGFPADAVCAEIDPMSPLFRDKTMMT
jgi:hypothetical protein